MDLTKKRLKINDHFEITLGGFLFTMIVTIIEILGILCFNNWVFTPAVFVLLSNSLFSLRKRAEEEDKDKHIEELEERIRSLEERINTLIESKLSISKAPSRWINEIINDLEED